MDKQTTLGNNFRELSVYARFSYMYIRLVRLEKCALERIDGNDIFIL